MSRSKSSNGAEHPQQDSTTIEKIGRKQVTRETSRVGVEPLWLGFARHIYRELGADLDALSDKQADKARIEQATVRLRKLHNAYGKTVDGAQIMGIVGAISSASSMRYRHRPESTGELTGDKVRYACDLIEGIDAQLRERCEKHVPLLADVIKQWPKDTPESKKWPLLREFLGAIMPEASIPKSESLRTTWQKLLKQYTEAKKQRRAEA